MCLQLGAEYGIIWGMKMISRFLIVAVICAAVVRGSFAAEKVSLDGVWD